MGKQSKVDAINAFLRVTVPLAAAGGYDAALARIQNLSIEGGTIEIRASGVVRVPAPISPTPAAAVTDPKQLDEIPSFLRKPKP